MVDLHMDESAGRATGVTCRQASGKEVRLDADAVVFAVGVTGMQKLVQSVPALARRSFFRGMCNLKGIDVVAARVWLDKKVDTKVGAALRYVVWEML